MFVVKRNGKKEPVLFDKITQRISYLIDDHEKSNLDPVFIGQKVIAYIHNGITTEELDIESAKICATSCTKHPLYSFLGGRILVSNLHKKNNLKFSEKTELIKKNIDILDNNYYNYVKNNKEILDKIVNYNQDYIFDYFGFKTLERAYLITNKKTNYIYESPQDMFMRVATFLNMGDLPSIEKTYELLSTGSYIHASPTLFNSGCKRSQLASCFLIGTDDSMEGITDTWKHVSNISKYGGGIGLHVSNIRSKGTLIKGTNGPSSGIIPMLKVYNEIARYVNQGGKRKGSFAIYLETHHYDIFDFLDLRKNFGDNNLRARDLFQSLWISDLFMKQVENDGDWYLMCPNESPNLENVWGKEYEELYWKYVSFQNYKEKIKARKLWNKIIETQFETGMPYVGFKDSVNRKSNQQNIGTIKSSNLCAEIVEYSSKDEHAVCNLASIALNKMLIPFDSNGKKFIIHTKEDCKFCTYSKKFLNYNNYEYMEIIYSTPDLESGNLEFLTSELKRNNKEKLTFPQIFVNVEDKTEYIGGFEDFIRYTSAQYNYSKLYDVAYQIALNLDSVIDLNYYPTLETKKSNMRHRPVGVGIQGLADTLVQMKINFESEEALELNAKIMETIYYASLNASCDLSKKRTTDMCILIDYLRHFGIKIPEYYDSNFNILSDEQNKIYHKLKVHSFEINLNPDDTIGSYSTFKNSPVSKGILQYDMWGLNESDLNYNWLKLKEEIKKYGIRNSLSVALMPTASTSQILGNNECFEYFTSNIYTRNTLAGDFTLINRYLISDLLSIGLWNTDIKDLIISNYGSVQNINTIPKIFLDLYKTQWELKQIWVLKAAKARSPFVDQSQSMNIFMKEPDSQKINSMLYTSWKYGLKTGIYYLRTKPASNAIQFTIDPSKNKNVDEECIECSA